MWKQAMRMSWWGKLLGGSFGYYLGGPLAAVAGVALGHNFDMGIKGLYRLGWLPLRFRLGLGAKQRVQSAFFSSTFSTMGHLAKIDGRVTEGEIELAQTVMSQMRLTPEQRQAAIRLFNEGKRRDFPLNTVLNQVKAECNGRRSVLRMFLEILMHTAYADGEMHITEKHLLLQISERLGFSRRDFEKMDAMIRAQRHFAGVSRNQNTRNAVVPQVDAKDAYAALGISRDESVAGIKKAYRRLMSQHHPDKLVAKGLPEDMMKLATEKTHEIKRAYDQIRRERGF